MLNLAQFKWMVDTDQFVVIDTETGGFGPECEICQIAILSPTEGVLLDTLVRPVSPMNPRAIEVHGITDQMVKDAPTMRDIIHQFTPERFGRYIVSYNATFDRGALKRSMDAHLLPRLAWEFYGSWACAMDAYAQYHRLKQYNQVSYMKLSAAARREGIEQPNAHNALADCMTTLALVKAIAKGLK